MRTTSIVILALVCLVVSASVGFGVFHLLDDEGDRPTLSEDEVDRSDFEAGVDTSPPSDEAAAPTPARHEVFNTGNALACIYHLSSDIGLRVEGTPSDRLAADYISSVLSGLGYARISEQSFTLKNGQASRNVYVEDRGSSPGWTVIVGAHYDTPGGTNSPGANDNASGVGVVLELARVFKTNEQVPTLRFAAFGAEERTPGYTPDDHHYGSRYMAAQIGGEGVNVIGMISVDMIGVGPTLTVYATLKAPKFFLDLFYGYCARQGVNLTFTQDKEWSDHESFEQHGISSFWIEAQKDYNYHTPGDTYDKIDSAKVEQVGLLLQGFLESLDADTCAELDAYSTYR